jgi:hypothetical protein
MRNIDIIAVILLVGFSSCSTKLDLVNAADPIPVVYFQMNPNDRINYLMLTRKFPGDANAYNLARDADQVFYAQADIRLEGWIEEYKAWETHFKPSEKSKIQEIFPEVPGYCFEAPNDGSFIINSTTTHYFPSAISNKMTARRSSTSAPLWIALLRNSAYA